MDWKMKNLFNLWDAANFLGIDWYREVHEMAWEIAGVKATVKDVMRICGILSATSANNTWKNNLNATKIAWHTQDPMLVPHTEITKRKVAGILEAETPEEIVKILNAPKTQNFFLNLYDPRLPDPVTIDRHAYQAMWKKPRTEQVTAKRYREAAEIYRKAAKKVGVLPHEFQAVVWCEVRRQKF